MSNNECLAIEDSVLGMPGGPGIALGRIRELEVSFQVFAELGALVMSGKVVLLCVVERHWRWALPPSLVQLWWCWGPAFPAAWGDVCNPGQRPQVVLQLC